MNEVPGVNLWSYKKVPKRRPSIQRSIFMKKVQKRSSAQASHFLSLASKISHHFSYFLSLEFQGHHVFKSWAIDMVSALASYALVVLSFTYHGEMQILTEI